MSKKDRLKAERESLRADRDDAEADIAKLTVEIERIEAGIEDRKESRKDTDDVERRKELHAAIREKVKLREERQEKLDARESRVKKLGHKIKAIGQKIHALGSPPIKRLNLSFRSMAAQPPIIGITGHYTAGPKDGSPEDAERLWRQYHAAHQAQGWAGLGYQIGFDRFGNIYLLRPFTYVGSHTLNNNSGRIGVSVHGTTGDTWTDAQRAAYRWWLDNGHTSKFPTSHRTPKPPRDLQIRVHNDFMATACPGSFEAGYRNP